MNFFKRLLHKPVLALVNKFSSRPDKDRVNTALDDLFRTIKTDPGKKGLLIPFDNEHDKFVILSDQHKGARDGMDIFAKAANTYLGALAYYNAENFRYINLGDSEELWQNMFVTVKKHNGETFEAEKLFLARKVFVKIFGNHDLYWDNDPLASVSLQQIYGEAIKVYEGAILQTNIAGKSLDIFITHGHQGDKQSDGNWFSKWFVSNIWGPVQAYLEINPNTPAYNNQLKTDHNRFMYEWSSNKENLLLVTGHTHQPVFRSLTHLESLYNKLDIAKREGNSEQVQQLEDEITALHLKGNTQPNFNGYMDTYFNSGCCCFDDGDITGIEISGGSIRLIKWSAKQSPPTRTILEQCALKDLKLNWQ